MRRLTDVTISSDDRPSPPRTAPARSGRPRREATVDSPRTRAEAAPRPRRRRATSTARRRLRAAVLIGLSVAVFVAAPLWAMRSGALAKARATAAADLIEFSQRAGLRVDQIVVDGRKRLAAQDLETALGIAIGDPTLGVDLAAAQTRIAALPGVKSVTVERWLPGEVHVLVVEREPIAIWQNDGRYQLVDADGMGAGDNIDLYPGLPLVVGEGAPGHAAALLAMIAAEKDLAPRVKASQWVSGQRWNIVMSGPMGDIEVRLPEDDPVSAWHELAKIEAEHKLLERKITMVDMRLPDRLVVRLPDGLDQTEKTIPNPTAHRKAPGRDA